MREEDADAYAYDDLSRRDDLEPLGIGYSSEAPRILAPFGRKAVLAPEKSPPSEAASFSPAVIGGAPPPRAPLAIAPGAESSEAQLLSFDGPSMYALLLQKGLSLMEHSPPRVQHAVWHDLMEVQGLIGKKSPEVDNGSRGSPTLNAMILGDKAAEPLVAAFREMARGLAIKDTK